MPELDFQTGGSVVDVDLQDETTMAVRVREMESLW
jgi:hypothetical protein